MTDLTLIAPVFDRITILPHFLRYYARQRLGRMVLVLWRGRQHPQWDALQTLIWDYPVVLEEGPACEDPADYHVLDELDCLNRARERHVSPGGWYLAVDLDEFVHTPGRSFETAVAQAIRERQQALHGVFVDRLGPGGTLGDLSAPNLDDAFPIACALTRSVDACVDKFPFAAGRVPIRLGHHDISLDTSAIRWNALEVHHFKWGCGIVDTLNRRARVQQAQGLTWHTESLRLARLLQHGRLDLSQVAVALYPATRLGV